MIKYALIIILILSGTFYALYATNNQTAVKMVDTVLDTIPGRANDQGKLNITLEKSHMAYPNVYMSKFNGYTMTYPYNWNWSEYMFSGVRGARFFRSKGNAEILIDGGPRYFPNTVLCADTQCDFEAGLLNIPNIAQNVKLVKGYKTISDNKSEVQYYRFSFYLYDASGVTKSDKPPVYVTASFQTKEEGMEIAKILSTLVR